VEVERGTRQFGVAREAARILLLRLVALVCEFAGAIIINGGEQGEIRHGKAGRDDGHGSRTY
jgi:hypothetical protein